MQKRVLGLAFFVFHVPSKKTFGDFVHIASCFFRSTFRPGPQRLQTAKKVPSSRHVRMDGTHTGKLSAESVRGRKAECAVQRSILSPGGYQGEGISVPRMRAEMGSPWSISKAGHLSRPLRRTRSRVYRARVALRTASTITPTSAKMASHIPARPRAPRARQAALMARAKTMFW